MLVHSRSVLFCCSPVAVAQGVGPPLPDFPVLVPEAPAKICWKWHRYMKPSSRCRSPVKPPPPTCTSSKPCTVTSAAASESKMSASAVASNSRGAEELQLKKLGREDMSRYGVTDNAFTHVHALFNHSDDESVTSPRSRMKENAGKTPGALERAVGKIMAEPSTYKYFV